MPDLIAVGRRVIIGPEHHRRELCGHGATVTLHADHAYVLTMDDPLPAAYREVPADGWVFPDADVLPDPPDPSRWESYAHHTVLELEPELERHAPNHRRIRMAVESELRWAEEHGVNATQLKLSVETLARTTWFSDNLVRFVEPGTTVVSVNGPRLRPDAPESGWVSVPSLERDHYAHGDRALCGIGVSGAHSREPLRHAPCQKCLVLL